MNASIRLFKILLVAGVLLLTTSPSFAYQAFNYTAAESALTYLKKPTTLHIKVDGADGVTFHASAIAKKADGALHENPFTPTNNGEVGISGFASREMVEVDRV